jgi:hypothetical protein
MATKNHIAGAGLNYASPNSNRASDRVSFLLPLGLNTKASFDGWVKDDRCVVFHTVSAAADGTVCVRPVRINAVSTDFIDGNRGINAGMDRVDVDKSSRLFMLPSASDESKQKVLHVGDAFGGDLDGLVVANGGVNDAYVEATGDNVFVNATDGDIGDAWFTGDCEAVPP